MYARADRDEAMAFVVVAVRRFEGGAIRHRCCCRRVQARVHPLPALPFQKVRKLAIVATAATQVAGAVRGRGPRLTGRLSQVAGASR